MEAFYKLTETERDIVRNALRVYSDYLAELVEQRKKEGYKPDNVSKMIDDALIDTDKLHKEFK